MSDNSPLVSVIMPCHNAERTVETAVRSVLRQSYETWELFVIDDASTDYTPAILASLAKSDARIKVLTNPTNIGVSHSRNRGVLEAKGGYIAFLDADDYWLPSKLAEQIRFMYEKDAVITCTSYRYMDINNHVRGQAVHPPSTVSYKQLLYGNTLGCLTVLVNADLMKEHLFPDDVFHEDYAVWLDIVREAGIAYGLPQVLSLYRVHDSKSANKWHSAKHVYCIFRRRLGFGHLQCFWYMAGYTISGIMKFAKRFKSSRERGNNHDESFNIEI